ncbi:pentapeptide repeat-containing protein [Stackebrandtia endophytica]|uniref:pentapeptide repeat-containing protein n=1 Tax=Stackebrandtia endophytica TaxID=1496996 RepID=UPI001476B1FB|nr:pentapeptide repeat-containing protein [Stackebrandtia endophytica]
MTVTAGITTVLWAGAGGGLAVVPANTSVLDLLKLGLTVTAGIGGVVALVVAYRKQRLNETAEQRLDAAATREDTKLFNERFGAAAQLLASAEPANRLAGIYAMAGLADDWNNGRQTCINVLCGYLRLPYTPPSDTTEDFTPEQSAEHAERAAHRQVRHALLDLLGERLRTEPDPSYTWHGYTFDLAGSTIDGGNLAGIQVTEGTRMNFEGAAFTGGEVSFSRARFAGGEVFFHRAEFTGGRVSFSGAKFTAGRVAFRNAEFTGGEVSFHRAEFTGRRVSFSGAKFTGGEVSFSGAEFTGGEVAFVRAEFAGGRVSFVGARFASGEVSFSGAEFTGGEVAFVGARFAGGEVSFHLAEFTSGEVSFHLAEFTSGRVPFYRAEFTSAEVDFRKVAVWDVPPIFENFPDGPPQGLHLPAQSGVKQIETSD